MLCHVLCYQCAVNDKESGSPSCAWIIAASLRALCGHSFGCRFNHSLLMASSAFRQVLPTVVTCKGSRWLVAAEQSSIGGSD